MSIVIIFFMIVSGLVFPGIISLTKAKMSGKKGASILQPYFDILKLLHKSSIYGETTSIIFQISPVIYFSSVVIVLFLIPIGSIPASVSFSGDIIYFAYILALGKFMMIIAAMDTGSGFEGMGANREALYSLLIEPAFFILMGSYALMTNTPSFSQFFAHPFSQQPLLYVFIPFSAYILFQISMIENSRMPMDDPKTHLELTMVHEVMILDHSGFDLALIHLATGLKFAIYSALIANCMTPTHWSLMAQLGCYIIITLFCAIFTGLMESFRARKKLDKNPQWILSFTSITITLFFLVLIMNLKLIVS